MEKLSINEWKKILGASVKNSSSTFLEIMKWTLLDKPFVFPRPEVLLTACVFQFGAISLASGLVLPAVVALAFAAVSGALLAAGAVNRLRRFRRFIANVSFDAFRTEDEALEAFRAIEEKIAEADGKNAEKTAKAAASADWARKCLEIKEYVR